MIGGEGRGGEMIEGGERREERRRRDDWRGEGTTTYEMKADKISENLGGNSVGL